MNETTYNNSVFAAFPAVGPTRVSVCTGAILDLDWRPDGTQLVSTSLDNTMRVWNWPSGEGSIVMSDQVVSALAYSPDGSELAYAGEIADLDDIRIHVIPVQALLLP